MAKRRKFTSVARRGRPWENGYAEKLIRTLKEEEVHLNDYENIIQARENASDILSHRCITRNAHIRR